MKRALICYFHGLGDVIQLTPHMRQLFNDGYGYKVDLMCRKQVKTTHLLDKCPYVDKLIEVPNPWQENDYDDALAEIIKNYNKLKTEYDWSGISTHRLQLPVSKIEMTSLELSLNIEYKYLEVFIPEAIYDDARKFIKCKYPDGYIHVHTQIENHPVHSWDATEWIDENLPDLPIINTGKGSSMERYHEDINWTFVLIRHATHRVYSSSVMVHASDALNKIIDIINYGKADRKVWPLEQWKVKHIRERGEMIK